MNHLITVLHAAIALFSVAKGAVLATAFIGWVDANVGATPQKRGEPGLAAGGLVRGFVQSWAKKTTDGNGTIYFVSQIPSDAIITSLLLLQDALTGLTSLDVGLYKGDKGLASLGGPSSTTADYNAGASTSGLPNSTPVDAGAIFESAFDSHAGLAQGSERNVLTNLPVQTVTTLGATTNGFLNYGLKIWALLGFTDPKWKEDSYVIGVRLNTAGSAAGNFVLRGNWIQG